MDTRDEALMKAKESCDQFIETNGRAEIAEDTLSYSFHVSSFGSSGVIFKYAAPRAAPPKGTMVRGCYENGKGELFGRSTGALCSEGDLHFLGTNGQCYLRPCWEVLAPVEKQDD